MTLKRIAGVILAAAIAIAIAPAGGHAQTPAPPQKPAAPAKPAPAAPQGPGTGERFGAWVLGCPAAGANPKAGCVLVQQISETLSRKVVFVWLIQYDEHGQLLGAFRLPTGVFVNRGLVMKPDGKGDGLRVEYTRCDPNECQAIFSLSADLTKQLAGAKAVTVEIALTNGNTASVQLDMDGFAGALAALAARAKAAQPQ